MKYSLFLYLRPSDSPESGLSMGIKRPDASIGLAEMSAAVAMLALHSVTVVTQVVGVVTRNCEGGDNVQFSNENQRKERCQFCC